MLNIKLEGKINLAASPSVSLYGKRSKIANFICFSAVNNHTVVAMGTVVGPLGDHA